MTLTGTERLAAEAEKLGCGVKRGEPLAGHTTFRIGGACDVMITPDSVESLSRLVLLAREYGVRTLVLGKGSNMLCADEGFRGAVLLIGKPLDDISVEGDIIRAGAGAPLILVCLAAFEAGLSGLEFAYGIPGTIGGGVYMNAGAYGGEMKDVLTSVTVIDREGKLHTYGADELDLSYRHSRFCGSDDIIVSAEMRLTRGEKSDIEARMDDFMTRRKDKQPLNFPSAGSTFKRPEGDFAGRLIQESGLRGYTVGGAQVSEKHCGFVVNKGGATCADVMAVIEYVRKTVQEKTGVLLECEVKIIK
ncbi:MAG: UDP-N-acetylmuramate dehydrogenase [Ruminococcus sp.]|nr:UDP-N-acetylmuramate dehydrogenase [Ruminococcus sp.]